MLALFKLSDIVFIGLMAANSLLNMDNIFQVLSSFALKYVEQNVSGDDFVQVGAVARLQSNSTWVGPIESASCDENTNPKILAVCPHKTESTFIIHMALWGAYYIILIIVRSLYSWRFSFADYRYHFYIDQFNARLPSTLMTVAGIFFTLATFGEGIYYLVTDWDPDAPPPANVWAMIMFVILNSIGLLFAAQYSRTYNADLWDTEFSEEIPILELPGGNGLLNVIGLAFNRQKFFTAMQFALTDDFAGRGGLDKLTTKPELLRKMMLILAENEEQREENEKEMQKKNKKETTDASEQISA